jgi:hypothetical protein
MVHFTLPWGRSLDGACAEVDDGLMGFLDKAKAGATELAAKADTALNQSGLGGPGGASSKEADRYFRDLGVLAYLDAVGRPGDPRERERVIEALRGFEAQGGLGHLALQTSPPPPPGAAAAGATWGGAVGGSGPGSVPPPPSGMAPPPPPPSAPTAPPPPPPPPPPPN